MLQQVYESLFKLLGRKDKNTSIELIAMLITVLLVVIVHAVFLIVIFKFEMTFLVEDYGAVLLTLSFITFSILYFWLVKKFKDYT